MSNGNDDYLLNNSCIRLVYNAKGEYMNNMFTQEVTDKEVWLVARETENEKSCAV